MTSDNNSSVLSREASLENVILCKTHASAILREEPIQSLWSGYGKISRLILEPLTQNTRGMRSVIVKFVSPPAVQNHPRGWNTDTSSQRKMASYNIETNWYRQYATHGKHACAMPKHIASYHEYTRTWLILEDLDDHYPLRHTTLSVDQCKPCLRWLARFHARYLHKKPEALWPVGTYWHLQTRMDELDAMPASDLKNAAEQIDQILNNARYMSFVHGDAKVANFCFNRASTQVAMVDFQYVGQGCGIKDVAYFLGSALSDAHCQQHCDTLLDVYFQELRNCSLEHEISSYDYARLETEWRELYCYAWADFNRFLLGWMPGHKKINDYMQAMTCLALGQLSTH